MVDTAWEGKKSDTVKLFVTKEMITRFAEVTGATQPIHLDPEVAKQSGFTDIIAPPTFPTSLWSLLTIPWLAQMNSMVHVRQEIEYTQPIVAGETYYIEIVLRKIQTKKTKLGIGQFLQHDLVGYIEHESGSYDQGRPSFCFTSTILSTEETVESEEVTS